MRTLFQHRGAGTPACCGDTPVAAWGVHLAGLLLLLVPACLTAQQSGSQAQSAAPPAQHASRNPIERWNQMTPAERERELAKLPPKRAAEMSERIRRYNQLPPEKKQALRERYQRFTELPPDRQDLVRQNLRDFRQLPRDRQREVHRAVAELRGLPEPERSARLNSDEFRNRLSPQERQIVSAITENLPVRAK